MYRKHHRNKRPSDLQKGNERQIVYILTKRRYLRNNKGAEANDMINMGSDHRCVMATSTITTLEKSSHYKTLKGKHNVTKHEGMDQTGKNIEVEKPELEKKDTKRSSNFFFLKKKPPPQKKQQRKQKAKMQKH